MPATRAEMNGLERLLSASKMRKGINLCIPLYTPADFVKIECLFTRFIKSIHTTMEYARQALINLYALFEGLENIGSHIGIEGYIIGIAEECQGMANIIRDQEREIRELKAELELANEVFATVNTDVINMRSSLSHVLYPQQMKKIEELM